ncbi:MAG: hypothetical protein ABIZ91_14895 [Gemmatimonadaceae bacterium]
MSESDIRSVCDALSGDGLFETVERRAHDWSRDYDRETYLRLLNTYSDHRLLPPATRATLFRDVGDADRQGVWRSRATSVSDRAGGGSAFFGKLIAGPAERAPFSAA